MPLTTGGLIGVGRHHDLPRHAGRTGSHVWRNARPDFIRTDGGHFDRDARDYLMTRLGADQACELLAGLGERVVGLLGIGVAAGRISKMRG